MNVDYIAAAFPSEDEVNGAIEELQLNGFDRAQLGLLSPTDHSPGTVAEAYGESTAISLDDDKQQIDVLVNSLVGTVASLAGGAAVAAATAGAALPALLAAVASGATAVKIRELTGEGAAEDEAHWIATQISKGGIILFITFTEDEQRAKARSITAKHKGVELEHDKKL